MITYELSRISPVTPSVSPVLGTIQELNKCIQNQFTKKKKKDFTEEVGLKQIIKERQNYGKQKQGR